MLTRMTDDDWAVAVTVFRAVCSRRGDKGRDDRKFLEALHYFTLNNVSWRALRRFHQMWRRVRHPARAGAARARSSSETGL